MRTEKAEPKTRRENAESELKELNRKLGIKIQKTNWKSWTENSAEKFRKRTEKAEPKTQQKNSESELKELNRKLGGKIQKINRKKTNN